MRRVVPSILNFPSVGFLHRVEYRIKGEGQREDKTTDWERLSEIEDQTRYPRSRIVTVLIVR